MRLLLVLSTIMTLGACAVTPDGSVETLGGALRIGDLGRISVQSTEPFTVQTFQTSGYRVDQIDRLGPGVQHTNVLNYRSFGPTQHTVWVTDPDGNRHIVTIFRCRSGYRSECFLTDFQVTLYEDYWTCSARSPDYNLAQCRTGSGRLRRHRYE